MSSTTRRCAHISAAFWVEYAAYDPDQVRPIGEFADVLDTDVVPEGIVHLVARHAAAPVLGPALTRIGIGIGQDDLSTDPNALILADSESV